VSILRLKARAWANRAKSPASQAVFVARRSSNSATSRFIVSLSSGQRRIRGSTVRVFCSKGIVTAALSVAILASMSSRHFAGVTRFEVSTRPSTVAPLSMPGRAACSSSRGYSASK
jgi:hypothetical protein